ncbi:hypothetical protein L2E82_05229 [Cichorium intybus]|uniref:Uncharacterized protein n=1 Tax=Cichorium intybus TaxID=13427 RepID=A0ACB9H6S9_CICIN|nr:hypothetical protein L2E82_05229 [Cichorium intybus]
MAEDASSKKFLVSNFMGYKMVDYRHVMEQFHEILRILGQFAQHNLKMNEVISLVVIIDKRPLPGKKSLKTQELDNNPKGKNQVGSSSVNMVEGDGSKNSNKSKGKRKFKEKDDKSPYKKAKLNYVFVILEAFYMQDDVVVWWVDSGATSHFAMIFIDNVLYVAGIRNNLLSEIVMNKCGCKQVLESDKYILIYLSRYGTFLGFGYVSNESRDTVFDEERYTFIPRPRDMIQKSSKKNSSQAEDVIGGTDSVPGSSKPKRSTRARKAKRIQRLLVKPWHLWMLLSGKKQSNMRLILSCIIIYGY